jgi:hypothetical protein
MKKPTANEDATRSGKKRGYHLTNDCCFVTWSQSRIHDHQVFHGKLMTMVPKGSQVFGTKELHGDGKPHYHAVMRFPGMVNWPDARSKLTVEHPDGSPDTKAISICVPEKGESRRDFLVRTQSYCMKDREEWRFGKLIDLDGESVDRGGAKSGRGRYRVMDKVTCFECQRMLGGNSTCLCSGCGEALIAEQVSVNG